MRHCQFLTGQSSVQQPSMINEKQVKGKQVYSNARPSSMDSSIRQY